MLLSSSVSLFCFYSLPDGLPGRLVAAEFGNLVLGRRFAGRLSMANSVFAVLRTRQC